MRMYSSEDLAALVAIADTGSVRAAAAAVGRTQPAVTQAIRRLESAVGFLLLDRSGYRARLTERGELFVRRARTAVQHSRGLEHFATLLSGGIEPSLRIVCHGAIAVNSWIGITQGVAGQFPDTRLELETAEGDAPLRRLLQDEAHLALLLHTVPERYGVSVEGKQLGTVDFVNVVRADKIAELSAGTIPQVLVADFDDPTTAYGVADVPRYCRVSNHRIKAAVIVRGDGWGSVPRALVAKELRSGTLQAVSHLGLKDRSRWPFSLFRKRDQPHGPVALFIWHHAHRTATR